MKKPKKSAKELYLDSFYRFFPMILMLISIRGFAQPSQAMSGSSAPYNQALKTMENKTMQQELMKTQQAAATQKPTSSEIMMIDPSIRAQDFKEAFQYLMQYKAGSPLYFELENQEKLYSVLDMSLMKGGTLVIFKINTTQGIKYRVVKTEALMSIGND